MAYFNSLFRSSPSLSEDQLLARMSVINPTVSFEDNHIMTAPYT